MERATIDVYERAAAAYPERRPPKSIDRATAFAPRRLPGLPAVDLGCGPGGYLSALGPDVVALDAALAMLAYANPALPVAGDLEALPFRAGSLGGAWARNTYLHVAKKHLPLALAQLHRAMAVGAPLELSVVTGDDEGPWPGDDFPGRFFARWQPHHLADVIGGAGFDDVGIDQPTDDTWVRAHRGRTLPDFVGPGLRLLVCGLNPSVIAADAGIGYATPTNRFWPAALEAGLVTKPRDGFHALRHHGIGMTDLVKRATANASGLRAAEYRAGAARVGRLVEWLEPRAVVFVGLTGWRAAVDATAVPGLQPQPFGGAPAYVMPSTSGANAHTNRAELVDHLRRAAAVADEPRSDEPRSDEPRSDEPRSDEPRSDKQG